MSRNKIAACFGIFGVTLLSHFSNEVKAQDVHFTQFNMNPLSLNPAFTGAFDGDLRASAIYRDQWRNQASGKAVFRTYAASIDAPIIRDIAVDDYLAGGIQLYSDVAGDGNLANFTALASVAYHKFLGVDGKKALTVGLQGGYVDKGINLQNLYFGDEFNDGSWMRGSTIEELKNKTSNFIINAGLAWSHSVTEKISYVIGVGGNNLNLPNESFNERSKANSQAGLGMRYTAQAGAIIGITDRFSIRPAVLYQMQQNTTELLGGAEFHYNLGDNYEKTTAPAIFAGAWIRQNDAIMATVGVEWSGYRLGLAYDFNNSEYNKVTNGNGGFEIALRYIKPGVFESAKKLVYPCGRF